MQKFESVQTASCPEVSLEVITNPKSDQLEKNPLPMCSLAVDPKSISTEVKLEVTRVITPLWDAPLLAE